MNAPEPIRSRAELRRWLGPTFVAWLATHGTSSRQARAALLDAALPLAAAVRRARIDRARKRASSRRSIA